MPDPAASGPPAADTRHAAPGLSGNMLGALWMLGSAVSFTVMAVLAKWLGSDVSVAMLIFWRAAAGVVAALPFLVAGGLASLKLARPGKVAFRAGWSTLGFFLAFYALVELPLADNMALSFTRTLFITILAVFVLRERVAWRRWSAVAVGFVGVLLMTRPGAALSLGSLAALGAAFAFAVAIVTVKDLTRDHTPAQLVISVNLVTALAGLPFLLADPTVPSLPQLLLLLAMGFAGVAAQSCYIRALGTGDASLMGLMDYVRLPLGALAGFLLFAEVPDSLTLLGAAIVIGSTVYITVREARIAARSRGPDAGSGR
jgi:drug/metabolite transporter (DMT)-like permease